MSSETDHPRQRTVAELLAEHGGGDAAATGRRRRRRESDESEANGQVVPLAPDPVVTRAPAAPDRSVLRDAVPPARAVPDEARERWAPRRAPVDPPAAQAPAAPQPPAPVAPAPASPVQAPQAPASPVQAPQAPQAPAPQAQTPHAQPPVVERPVPQQASAPVRPTAVPFTPTAFTPPAPPATPEPVRENPTDVMPRFRDSAPAPDTGPHEDLFTRPIPHQSTSSPADDEDDAGPSTMIGGAPVGAEDWHRARTEDARRDGTAIDGGPPLPLGPVDADEEPAGLGARRPAVDLDKHPEGFDDEPPPPRERRLGRGAAASKAAAPTWAAVMVQWIAGALGGAVLWVLFRFLWRNLPVVALASAVLVTVGLVVIVRALLHNDDRRTTIFAVLVGLLLTVSPAILVLLGR
jgi:hypothetical protein